MTVADRFRDDAPPVRHRFVEIEGLRLHLLDHGGGERPALMLHGAGGGAWTWRSVGPRLTGVARVLAPDLRGYGESQRSSSHSYATADHARDVIGIVETAELAPVDLVGFSWGGLIALAVAGSRPELVRRLAAIDIPPSFAQSETEIPKLPRTVADHAEAVEVERRLAPRADEATLEAMAQHATRPADDGGLVRACDPYLLEQWPFRGDDRWDELAAIQQPLLIVRGQESPVLSAEDAERMREAQPEADYVEIAGSGHLVPAERPAELAAALTRFLEPHRGTGGS